MLLTDKEISTNHFYLHEMITKYWSILLRVYGKKKKMLNIQSVGIKKYKDEPALFTKPSLLICTCLETVIKLGCMRTIKFNFPSYLRPKR